MINRRVVRRKRPGGCLTFEAGAASLDNGCMGRSFNMCSCGFARGREAEFALQ